MRNEQNHLTLSSSSITGTTVRSTNDESIGQIKDLMIDIESGEVLYAVLSVNTGFLNLDSKYFAIPLEEFQFDTTREEAILNVTKERLEQSPGFDKDHWPTSAQHEFVDQVHSYYGRESRYATSGLEGSLANDRDFTERGGKFNQPQTASGMNTGSMNTGSTEMKSGGMFDKKDDVTERRGYADKDSNRNIL